MMKNYNLLVRYFKTTIKTQNPDSIDLDQFAKSTNTRGYLNIGLLLSFFIVSVFTTMAFAQASVYTFAQSNGTYNAITGGTVVTTSTNGTPSLDSYVSGALTIPAFKFAGATYTQMYVTSNGQISLGTTAPSSYTYTVLSSATGNNVFLAPLSGDLNGNPSTIAEIRYETIGNEIVVQWKNFQRYGVTENINFQVRMNTVTDVIKFVYDGTPPYGTATSYQPQVGIKSGADVYHALTVAAAGGSWNNPVNITSGIVSGSVATFSGNVGPTSGLTYTWTPGIAVAPNCAINFAPINAAVNVARNPTLTWASGGGNATSYDVYFGTSATPAFIANQVGSSYTPTAPLISNTTYYWKIVPKNTTGEGTGCTVNSFTTGSSLPYCIPSSTSSATFINNFSTTLGTTNISNTSGYTTGGYQDNFSSTGVTAVATGSFNFNFSVTGGTLGAAIWVDWSNNGTFEATERVFVTTGYGSGPYSNSITIPAGTLPGDYRMRVMVDYNSSAPSNPCMTANARTETEDYKITVGAQNSCNGTPTAATISTSQTNICVSGTATLTAIVPPSTEAGFTYQWYNSAGIVAGATGLTFTTPILSSPESYYIKTTCSTSGLTANSNTVAIFITNPSVVTNTAGNRCGTGTVNLSATASAGANINWYANATGGAPLFTGNNFTTPSIATTTTYYVAASEGATAESAAKPSSTGTDGSFVFTSYGILFNSTIAATLSSTVIYPTGTGTVTIALYDSAGVELASTPAVAVTGSGISTPVTVPLNFTINPGTGYRLLLKNYTGITGLIRDFTNVFPYNSTNTSVTGGWAGSSSTAYYFFYNLQVTTGCSSARTAVVATVSNPPVLALSATNAAICSGSSTALLTVTTGGTDYDSYVWSPSAGVTGNSTTGWTFNPTATTTYTLTATQSAGNLCGATATYQVTVNPLPSALTISPVTSTICANQIQTLAAFGGQLTVMAKIGSGAAANTVSTPFKNNWGGAKTQAIYTAAELSAIGLQAGQSITSVGYVALSSAAAILNGFTVKAGLVPSASLGTSFSTAATTIILAPTAYTPAGTGNIDFPLSTPLIWDGVSHLLIETCFNNNDYGSGLSTSVESSIVASGLNIYFSDDAQSDICSNPGFPSATTTRPNLRISASLNSAISWSPISNLYSDAAATIPYAGGNSTMVYVKNNTAGSQVYTATATTAITGCTATATTTITTTATDAPTALAQTFCGGSTVADLVATGTAVQWYAAENGGTALANTVVLATGTYYVSQTINACESARTSVSITVNTTPAPISIGKVTFCAENPTVGMLTLFDAELNSQFYLSATGGTALASDVVLSNGTYYVSHTINNCESTRTSFLVEIDLLTPPTASAQTLCAGATVADLVASESAIRWYSDLVGGTPLLDTTLLVSGTYYVSVFSFECESTRTSVEVTVNGLPTATITRVDDTLSVYEANATYQWVSCGDTQTPIAGATSQTYTATAVGSYAVIVTSQNGCSATSECFDITTLSNKTFDAAKLGYYPNPVTDVLTVSHTDIISSIQVFDIAGRILRNMKVNATEATVDMVNMPAAVYIVKVFTDNTSGEFKVVKK